MSLIRHQLPPPRKTTLGTWLKAEWQHVEGLPMPRFLLLFLPTILLIVISPLLPITAYALQRWASGSWAWRDRWASVTSWAKQGGVLVALILIYAALSAAQVWIFPGLTAALQAFWRAYLPGELSLSPLDIHSLFARTLLLLPLAPALALLYERIDPQTRVQPQRVLTPADLAEPTPPAAVPSASPTKQGAPPARKKSPPPSKAPMTQRKRKSTREPPRQMTIESFLEPSPAQAAPSVEVQEKKTEPPAQAHPPAPTAINWDDVAE
jgi:hypothetical protein